MVKRIEFSLDRIASTISLPEMSEDFMFVDIAEPIISIFKKYAGNTKLEFKTGYAMLNISVLGQFEHEPLIFWSKPDFVRALRLDYNPRRFRDLKWPTLALKEIISKIEQGNLVVNPDLKWLQGKAKVTQTDVAIDLYDYSPDSRNLVISKLGSTVSQVMSDRSNDVLTTYFGSRSSSSYARLYVKTAERRNAIINKYRSKKKKIINVIDRVSNKKNTSDFDGFDLTDDDEREQLISHFIDLSKPTNNINNVSAANDINDVVDVNSLKNFIEVELDAQKSTELEAVPKDWLRLEIVLRVQALKSRGFDSKNRLEFDPKSVDEYLEKINIQSSYDTVSDTMIRAVIYAHRNNIIDKKDLPKSVQRKMNAVLKWDDVTSYYSKGGSTLKYKPTKELEADDVIVQRITRSKTSDLKEQIQKGFLENKQALLDELNSYFI